MKLTVLLDNNTFVDQYYLAEPGLAIDLQTEDQHFLFDAGYSDAYMKNAEKMGIDWKTWKTIIISHGHADHTWGLLPLFQRYMEEAMKANTLGKPSLIAHPEAFESKWKDEVELGANLTKESLQRAFCLDFERNPRQLTERLMYLGEIPRTNDFEGVNTFGKTRRKGVVEGDAVADDTALAYQTAEGLVVITGCAHSGICNTVEHAKKVCGDHRILDIIGGFHLQQTTEEVLRKTVDYLKKQKPRHVYAGHCTDLKAKIALAAHLDVREVGVGLELRYDLAL